MIKLLNSISTRASVILMLAGSLILVVIVGIMQWVASNALRQELIDDNHTLAAFISHNIDSILLDYKRLLLVEAGKSTLIKAVTNPDDSDYYIKDYIDELSKIFPDTEMYLYAFDGTSLGKSVPEYFFNGESEIILNSINNKLSRIILDEGNKSKVMLYFISPIIYGKHAEGALVTCLPFNSIFAREAWLVYEDSRINVIAEGNTGILAQTKEQVYDSIKSDALCSVIPLKIIIESPKDIVEKPLFNMKLSMGVIGAVIILIAVVSLNFTVKKVIIQPILRLRAGVIGIAEDGWKKIPEIDGDVEEIQVLIKAFNTMQSSLKDRTAMLFQAEKMSSVGQLAAGVAHEINNPSSFVISNLETLIKYVEGMLDMLNICQERIVTSTNFDADTVVAIEEFNEIQRRIDFAFVKDDIRSLLNETIDGMNRITRIVSGLKDFSHVDKGEELIECNLNEIIDNTINIAWNELKYKCTIHKNYHTLPLVHAYDGQLSQVILNLLVNASQAINEKGNIFITTAIENDFAMIKIRDDGVGISDNVINTIFDPFFTTKPVGKGTGLGLHICQKIIAGHGGSILVESKEGDGTVFTILLPLR